MLKLFALAGLALVIWKIFIAKTRHIFKILVSGKKMASLCSSSKETLGFILATGAGLMTFIGAFTVFVPIKKE